LFILLGK